MRRWLSTWLRVALTAALVSAVVLGGAAMWFVDRLESQMYDQARQTAEAKAAGLVGILSEVADPRRLPGDQFPYEVVDADSGATVAACPLHTGPGSDPSLPSDPWTSLQSIPAEPGIQRSASRRTALMPPSARTNNCVQFVHADVEERERVDWVRGRCKVVRLRAIPDAATELCERAGSLAMPLVKRTPDADDVFDMQVCARTRDRGVERAA